MCRVLRCSAWAMRSDNLMPNACANRLAASRPMARLLPSTKLIKVGCRLAFSANTSCEMPLASRCFLINDPNCIELPPSHCTIEINHTLSRNRQLSVIFAVKRLFTVNVSAQAMAAFFIRVDTMLVIVIQKTVIKTRLTGFQRNSTPAGLILYGPQMPLGADEVGIWLGNQQAARH